MREEIGIAGGGPRLEMLARLVERGGRRVVVWREEGAAPVGDLAEVSEAKELGARARLIFVVAPSWRLGAVAHGLGAGLDGGHRVVHMLHGLDMETGCRGSELLRRETASRQVGVLVSAVSCVEQVEVEPGAALVASRFPAVIKEVQGVLSSPMFRVYGSLDLEGAEVASAASGVVALAVGLLDGLSMGVSARGMLVARGVAEISRVVEVSGGSAKTGAGMAGLGLLVSQTASPGGVEFAVGRALSQGKGVDEVLEAYGAPVQELKLTSEVLLSRMEAAGAQAHILRAAQQILTKEVTVPEAVRELFSLHQMME